MKSKFPSTEPMRKRATNELKEFAVVAAYLCLCFTAILYLKASILKAEGAPQYQQRNSSLAHRHKGEASA